MIIRVMELADTATTEGGANIITWEEQAGCRNRILCLSCVWNKPGTGSNPVPDTN